MSLDDDLLVQRYEIDQLRRRVQQLESTRNFVSKDGTFTVYDSNGKPILVMGKQSDGKYGLSVFDASGTRQNRVGELSSGYGIEALNPAGVPVALDDLAFSMAAARVDTSETKAAGGGFGDLATAGPSVTVDIGPLGRALVHITCGITTPSGGQGKAGYAVSGASSIAADAFSAVIVGGEPGQTAINQCGSTYLVTGLSAGSNTFTMKYAATGGTITFYARTIAVQPF
jgi:hypothetical protein